MAKMWTGQTGEARVFMQDYGPGPENEPELLKCVNLEGLDWPQGDLTPIFCQGDRYGQFEQVDAVRGAPESPSSSMNMLMSKRNPILGMVCPFNIYVHYGKCRDPNSFNLGWEMGFTYESAEFSGKTSEALVTHEGEGAAIHFGGAFAAFDFFQHDPILFGPEATVEALGAEVVGIVVCDWVDCGDCGAPSNGCQKIYAVTAANVGSGIVNPQVLATEDGGTTWTAYPILCLTAVAGPPSPMACVGSNYLVVLGDPNNLYATGEIAYAEFDDLTAWTCVTDGLVANHYPHAIFSLDTLHTWLVGEGGYVYFTSYPPSGVTVQSPADATNATLRDVHFYNSEVGLAVGDAGTVIFTRDGGTIWQAATTTWTEMNLCCEAASEYVWWVGDEDGILHYTVDGGLSWGTKDIAALKGAVCEIQDIQFGKPSKGFILVNQYTALYPHPGGEIAGQVFRTLDGGQSWYELPEPVTGSTMPPADAFNSIATCGPNEIWIAGLADDHLNGVIVHGRGYG